MLISWTLQATYTAFHVESYQTALLDMRATTVTCDPTQGSPSNTTVIAYNVTNVAELLDAFQMAALADENGKAGITTSITMSDAPSWPVNGISLYRRMTMANPDPSSLMWFDMAHTRVFAVMSSMSSITMERLILLNMCAYVMTPEPTLPHRVALASPIFAIAVLRCAMQ